MSDRSIEILHWLKKELGLYWIGIGRYSECSGSDLKKLYRCIPNLDPPALRLYITFVGAQNAAQEYYLMNEAIDLLMSEQERKWKETITACEP